MVGDVELYDICCAFTFFCRLYLIQSEVGFVVTCGRAPCAVFIHLYYGKRVAVFVFFCQVNNLVKLIAELSLYCHPHSVALLEGMASILKLCHFVFACYRLYCRYCSMRIVVYRSMQIGKVGFRNIQFEPLVV